MIKKISAFVLVVIMVVCFGGCGSKSTYDLVNAATKKTATLDSYSAKMTMDMEMTLGNETTSVGPIVYDITASGTNGKNPTMRIKTTSKTDAGESQMDMYVENGNYYISVMGQKYQVPAAVITEDMKMENTLDGMIADMPANLFDGVEVTEKDGGIKVVTLTPDEQTFQSLYSQLLEQTTTSLGTVSDGIELSNISVEIAVDNNGYIAYETISFKMKLDMEVLGKNREIDASASIKVEYLNPGSKVEVEPIEGYKDFAPLG